MQYHQLSDATAQQLLANNLVLDDVRRIIAVALDEDLKNGHDVTTNSTVPESQRSTGIFATRMNGCIAGIDVAVAVLEMVCGSQNINVSKHVDDCARVKPGDKLNVVVIKTQGSDGNPIVSRKQAEFEEQWDRIVRSFEDGSSINAMVVDRVKGGLVVDVGVRGFVPATHVGNGKLRNIDKYVGQNLVLKVIELDRDRKKVVLSNRQAEEETRTAARGEIFKNIKVGDIVTGTVRRLTDYGAFVDLGGVDGLLHISEMSWARIAHPKEMFKDGQEIQVMVLRLDQGVGKISLGHRQVLPDPWNLIKQNYKIGQNLKKNC